MKPLEEATDLASGLGDLGGPSNAGAVVVARDVFKIYNRGRSETVALRGASLDIAPGEFVSLMGPSGSGKTSLLSIVAGLSAPSAGQVVVDGLDLGELDETGRAKWRSERVGIVFQRGNLLPFLSAEENVALVARRGCGRREAKERSRRLLEALGLADRARHRPDRLSGGEAQRAGIAVALANDPALVLGDEITGELDTATTEQVMDLLVAEQRERGFTMVLVTHNPAVGALADRALEMRDGTVR